MALLGYICLVLAAYIVLSVFIGMGLAFVVLVLLLVGGTIAVANP